MMDQFFGLIIGSLDGSSLYACRWVSKVMSAKLQRLEWPDTTTVLSDLSIDAAQHGYIALLDWYLGTVDKRRLTVMRMESAAAGGQLAMIEWLHQQYQCP